MLIWYNDCIYRVYKFKRDIFSKDVPLELIKENSRPVSRVLCPLDGCLSFIYTLCRHRAKAFYPPARTSSPQMPVYMNLQLPRRTARTSLHDRWALTPPSHPYPCGRLFSSTLLCLRRQLSVRKWNALCCPDFPPLYLTTATDRSTVFLFCVQRYE